MRQQAEAESLSGLLEPIVAIAEEAGREIVEIYRGQFDVEHKADQTPLTEADMAAHHTIVDGLEALTPGIPVLSEESGAIPFSERASWERYWLVDPLDGTREFIKRNGEFTVNIALINGHEPLLGVIHVPVTGVTYYGCRGCGAIKHVPGQEPEKIHVRHWEGGTLIVAGSRSHRSKALDAFLAKMGDHEIISMGSSLKSCLVAEGKADIYVRLGLTSEWDTAAAQCIVEEAGGKVTDTHMRPLRYNTKDSLLNPHFMVFGDDRHDWGSYLPKE